MKRLILLIVSVVGTMVPKVALAHCPLCTVGAGALAVLAASLGVSSVIVGVLIGAFALALGLWLSGLVKKTYLPFQKPILAVVIFLGTVIPIMPLIQHYGPWYVALGGPYGTLWHNTYTINLYVLGVVIGSVIMLLSPRVSRLVTKFRGRAFPYQGLIITFALLVAISMIIQFQS